jgi:AsmA-like protein
MKLFRILIAILMVVVILVGGAFAIAWRNQDRLIQLVLTRIHVETGYDIVPAGARIVIRNHLVVLLEKPRIYLNGVEVAQVDDLRAVVSFHSIVSSNGLPLYALALDHPRVRIPAGLAGVTPHGFPKPDIEVVNRVKWALDAISDVAQRIEIVDAALNDVDGTPLVDHLTLTAYRQHRGIGKWPWMVNFNAGWDHAPFARVVVTGRVRLGNAPGIVSRMVLGGLLTYHGLELEPFHGPYGIQTAGQLAGSIRYALRDDGQLFANTVSSGKEITFRGKPLITPIALGNLTLHASYIFSTQRLELKEFTVTHNGAALFTGGGSIDQPYADTRTASFHVEGVQVSLTQAAVWLRALRAVPPPLNDFARRVTAGRLEVNEAVFNPRAAVKDWTARTLREDLTVHSAVTAASFNSPESLKLPPVRSADAAIEYAAGILTLTQGSASLGHSALSVINGEININRAPELVSYKLRSRGRLDIGEVYPALARMLKVSEPDLAAKLDDVKGTSAFGFSTAGKISNLNWSVPSDYAVKISPERIEIAIHGAPSPIAIKSGDVELRPGSIAITQIIVTPTTPRSGNAAINGTIIADQTPPTFRNFTAELHEFRAETWLPLMLDPQQFAAKGAVGGRLIAESDPASGGFPTITGRLIMGPGELRLGFLRSPIVASSMTVALDGKGMKLNLPGGELEGHPINLAIALADFNHPIMQLDATSSDLDFEVMKFIRMPWSQHSPPQVFDLAIRGHIVANHALFGKLVLTNVATDFDRLNGEWHVKDFTAKSLDGQVKLNLSGLNGPDNHIHIQGRVNGIDARALCTLMGQSSPALVGRLSVTADLWADTDIDFFASLNGTAAVEVLKGTLNRFVLVTRVLSFVDLKNWLTAHLPDPRVSGIPFDTLTASLKGANGVFDTRDLRLSGPVMEITARGNVNLSDSTMDMEISLIPFDTVNWLVRKIPIIGRNLSGGSRDLIAAYFQVRGPIGDPSVSPKPITSVAEFVAKTLSLPINLIAPNTIKP